MVGCCEAVLYLGNLEHVKEQLGRKAASVAGYKLPRTVIAEPLADHQAPCYFGSHDAFPLCRLCYPCTTIRDHEEIFALALSTNELAEYVDAYWGQWCFCRKDSDFRDGCFR